MLKFESIQERVGNVTKTEKALELKSEEGRTDCTWRALVLFDNTVVSVCTLQSTVFATVKKLASFVDDERNE